MTETTGVETLARDASVQDLWARRLAAIVVDWLLCLVVLAVVGFAPFAVRVDAGASLAGVLLFVYTVGAEYFTGQTLGKMLMGLRLSGPDPKKDPGALILREVSKVFPILLFLDVLIGLITDRGGQRRYLEVLSKVVVVRQGPGAAAASPTA